MPASAPRVLRPRHAAAGDEPCSRTNWHWAGLVKRQFSSNGYLNEVPSRAESATRVRGVGQRPAHGPMATPLRSGRSPARAAEVRSPLDVVPEGQQKDDASVQTRCSARHCATRCIVGVASHEPDVSSEFDSRAHGAPPRDVHAMLDVPAVRYSVASPWSYPASLPSGRQRLHLQLGACLQPSPGMSSCSTGKPDGSS